MADPRKVLEVLERVERDAFERGVPDPEGFAELRAECRAEIANEAAAPEVPSEAGKGEA